MAQKESHIERTEKFSSPNLMPTEFAEMGKKRIEELVNRFGLGPHLDALRAWVRDGTVSLSDTDARAAVADLSDDEIRARLHFRIATEARRRGDDAVARRHFARAGELAPMDFTIRRAAMPLMGQDPFGEDFMALYQAWNDAGSPFHGLPSMKEPG